MFEMYAAAALYDFLAILIVMLCVELHFVHPTYSCCNLTKPVFASLWVNEHIYT